MIPCQESPRGIVQFDGWIKLVVQGRNRVIVRIGCRNREGQGVTCSDMDTVKVALVAKHLHGAQEIQASAGGNRAGQVQRTIHSGQDRGADIVGTDGGCGARQECRGTRDVGRRRRRAAHQTVRITGKRAIDILARCRQVDGFFAERGEVGELAAAVGGRHGEHTRGRKVGRIGRRYIPIGAVISCGGHE